MKTVFISSKKGDLAHDARGVPRETRRVTATATERFSVRTGLGPIKCVHGDVNV